jgi:uncharacterized protein YxeA
VCRFDEDPFCVYIYVIVYSWNQISDNTFQKYVRLLNYYKKAFFKGFRKMLLTKKWHSAYERSGKKKTRCRYVENHFVFLLQYLLSPLEGENVVIEHFHSILPNILSKIKTFSREKPI